MQLWLALISLDETSLKVRAIPLSLPPSAGITGVRRNFNWIKLRQPHVNKTGSLYPMIQSGLDVHVSQKWTKTCVYKDKQKLQNHSVLLKGINHRKGICLLDMKMVQRSHFLLIQVLLKQNRVALQQKYIFSSSPQKTFGKGTTCFRYVPYYNTMVTPLYLR